MDRKDSGSKPSQLAVFADLQQVSSKEEEPVAAPQSQLLNLSSDIDKTQKSGLGSALLIRGKMESQDRIDITNQIVTDHSQIDSTFKREESQPCFSSNLKTAPAPFRKVEDDSQQTAPMNKFSAFGGSFRAPARVEKADVEMKEEEHPAPTTTAPTPAPTNISKKQSPPTPKQKQPKKEPKPYVSPVNEEQKKKVFLEI